jgi:serine protease AprX
VNIGHKLFRLMTVLTLLSGVLTPGLTSPLRVQAANLHPLLAQLAAESPEQTVAVIVQKAETSKRAEELVVQLGGAVTKDLRLINAFAAEMPAGAAQQLAASPAVRWVSVDGPIQSTGPSSAKFYTWATKNGTAVANGFTNVSNALGPTGPNQTYASASRAKSAFTGFQPEYTPGMAIQKIDIALRLYTAKALGSAEVIKVKPYVGGAALSTYTIAPASVNSYVGVSAANTLTVDITSARVWKWSDLASLQIVIDQSALSTKSKVYYDAVGLRTHAIPGNDTTTPLTFTSSSDDAPVNTSVLANVFPKVVRADVAWNTAPYYQGSGVTVAVVDSGTFRTNALGARLIGEVNFNSTEHRTNDQYGHGTFVSGIIGDDGSASGGQYTGAAPKVNILGVRIADDYGMGTESDLVDALQWIYNNKSVYNIRVVNLSLNAANWQSYHTSPLDAAVEILWFNGIVVVVSAGNNGSATLYPPANDPFVITVGATDDMNTVGLTDDVVAAFSAYGVDEAGQLKPDLVAPGSNIIAFLPDTNQLTISVEHPENQVNANYFRMSGTSMSAPIVAGGAAILLQKDPGLTPDQVKYRLKASANKNWPGYNNATAGAGYLDIYAAVNGTTTESANAGLPASQLLWSGTEPVIWSSVNWNSVNWNSVNWNSVNWNSVNWNSVNWNSDYWGP